LFEEVNGRVEFEIGHAKETSLEQAFDSLQAFLMDGQIGRPGTREDAAKALVLGDWREPGLPSRLCAAIQKDDVIYGAFIGSR
jgi:hypothetical protein